MSPKAKPFCKATHATPTTTRGLERALAAPLRRGMHARHATCVWCSQEFTVTRMALPPASTARERALSRSRAARALFMIAGVGNRRSGRPLFFRSFCGDLLASLLTIRQFYSTGWPPLLSVEREFVLLVQSVFCQHYICSISSTHRFLFSSHILSKDSRVRV